jgi:hypothetical protein
MRYNNELINYRPSRQKTSEHIDRICVKAEGPCPELPTVPVCAKDIIQPG